jgi:hypothetical protein
MDYWVELNNGKRYICDRCNITKLRHDEYENNIRNDYRYCDECFTWLDLQVYKDNNGNTYKIRSERVIHGKLA